MQSCKEWQGEIRKPSSVNNEKKQRKIRNRFKGLNLIVPDELWMEVCDIVQETGMKSIPKKKKCKKAKWLLEEALQTVEERREVKAREKGKSMPS